MRKKEKRALVLWRITGFALSIAPLLVYVGLNAERLVSTPEKAVSFGVGAVLAALFLILKTLDRLPKLKRLPAYVIALAVFRILRPLTDDLIIILTAAIAGEVLDLIIAQPMIRKLKRRIAVGEQADASAAATREAIKELFGGLGNGRE